MAILQFSEISKEKRKLLFNGCGTKFFLFNVPEFIFHDSCLRHDFHYWRGGTEEDRAKADKLFYKDMMRDLKFQPWYKRSFYRIIAWLYYMSVRWGGGIRFNYGEMKTHKDLESLEAIDI